MFLNSEATLCSIMMICASLISGCGQGERIAHLAIPQINIIRTCDNLTETSIIFHEFTETVKNEILIRDYASCLQREDGLGYALIVNTPKRRQEQILAWLNSTGIANYKVATRTIEDDESNINMIHVATSFQQSCELWEDLISHRPNLEIQSSIAKLADEVAMKLPARTQYKYTLFRPLETAAHKTINLDLYQIVVYQPPSKLDNQEILPTMLQIFTYFKDHMNLFSPKGVNFYHYCDPEIIISGADQFCPGKDANINPLIYPGEVIHIELTKGILAHNDGSVIVTKRYFSELKSDVIFTTADSILDSSHPVSGNREFGFKAIDSLDNPIGTFYIRGADRITYTELAEKAIKLFSNGTLDGGDQVWLSVQRKMVDKINEGGGRAEIIRQEQYYRTSWENVKSRCFKPTISWNPSLVVSGRNM